MWAIKNKGKPKTIPDIEIAKKFLIFVEKTGSSKTFSDFERFLQVQPKFGGMGFSFWNRSDAERVYNLTNTI